MSKLLSGLGQLIIGINYLFTSVVVALKFGLIWGILSFAAVPVGALAAPFFVGTGGFVILGAIIYFIGAILTKSKEKRMVNSYQSVSQSQDSGIVALTNTAEIIGNATAMPMFEGEEIRGSGKLFGFKDGSLIWFGENGVSFEMGNSFRTWGKPQWGFESKDFYFVTNTNSEFVIDANEYSRWEGWFTKHHKK